MAEPRRNRHWIHIEMEKVAGVGMAQGMERNSESKLAAELRPRRAETIGRPRRAIPAGEDEVTLAGPALP